MIIAVIIADIIMGAAYFFLQSQLPPQVPVYYSRPWGEDQLADLWIISIIPIVMHLFIFGNMLTIRLFFKKNEFIIRTFSFANWLYLVLFPIIFIRILFLVS